MKEKEMIERIEKILEDTHVNFSAYFKGQNKNNKICEDGRVHFQFGDYRVETERYRLVFEFESRFLTLSNLIKYWYCITKNETRLMEKKTILIHMFEHGSRNDYLSHIWLWEFIKNQMEKDVGELFEAYLIPYVGNDIDKALEKVRNIIKSLEIS